MALILVVTNLREKKTFWSKKIKKGFFSELPLDDFLFFITNIFIQGKTIQTELFYHGALY